MRLRMIYPIFAVLIFSFFACARELPPTNYYVLGLPVNPPPEGPSDLPYSLVIAPFDAQSPLLRKSLVWRSDNRVGFYTYEKWAELPSRMFTYRLYRRASESNLFSYVQSGIVADNADFVLEGTLEAFEEATAPEGAFGRVAVQAALLDAERQRVWDGFIEQQEPIEGDGAQAAVQAISQAAEKVISNLLQSIAQALREYEISPRQD